MVASKKVTGKHNTISRVVCAITKVFRIKMQKKFILPPKKPG
jgi:Cu/Ag efflux protein CusF